MSVSVAAAVTVTGCSLRGFDRVACAVDADCEAFGISACMPSGYCSQFAGACAASNECHDALGFGYQCGVTGACEPLVLPPRCQTMEPFPGRLLEPGEFSDAVVFGSIADRSESWQLIAHNSQRLAILQANESGGLSNERDFGMIFCDTARDDTYDSLTRTEAAVEVSRFLSEEAGLPVVTGTGASSDFAAIYDRLVTMRPNLPIAEQSLLLSASATSPALTTLDTPEATDETPGLLWRTAPPDSLQAVKISEDMRARGVERVVVVHETGAYGEGLQSAFSTTFAAAGGTVVASFPFTDESQRAEQVANAANENFEEVLFVAQSTDVVAFLGAAGSIAGFDSRGIFVPDAAGGADTLAVSDQEVLARVRGTRPAAPGGPVFQAFISAFTLEYGTDPSDSVFVANAYDAAWLAVYGSVWSAAQREGLILADEVARGLRRVSAGPSIEIRGSTLANVRSNFQSGSSVNLIGTSGDLDYDPVSEETTAPLEVFVVAPRCTTPSVNAFGVVNVGQDRPSCIPE